MNGLRNRIVFNLSSNAVLILSLLVIATSCSKKQDDVIRIGVIGPLTGEGATYGEAMQRGFELAFENETKIKLVYEDSKLSAKEGVAAIQKLISANKVKVVLGAAASSVTIAIAPIAERSKIILFSSISTSDDLQNAGEYIFRNVPRNEIQGTTAAQFIYESLGGRNVAIFKKNDEYANNLSRSFKQAFENLGGSILFEEAYEPSSSDFRTSVAKIKNVNAEAVYIPGNYQEVALFLKQAREGGLKVDFVGGDGSYSPELISLAGNAAESTYYTLMSVRKNDYYQNFHSVFKTKYDREPDVYDAYAYEAASIILMAIKEVGYDATMIKDYLLDHTFNASLTGELTFDIDGEVDRVYGVVEVKQGEFVDVEW